MTIYTFPPALMRLTTVSMPLLPLSVSTPQSAFNPLTATNGPISEFWPLSMTIAPQLVEDWREVAALIRKLRGRRNKIRLFDPSRALRGAGGAGPTVNVAADAAAGATTMAIKNLVPSQAIALAADDFFGAGENLYAISDAAPSDSGGGATISFLPALRSGLAEGDPINLVFPTGLFMLTSTVGHSIGAALIAQPLSLEFMESPDFE